MPDSKIKEIFENYIRGKNLKLSEQRMQILDIFLRSERHLAADELYVLVKKEAPTIGFATIYRTLKLFSESGICREVRLEDGTTRFEHLYGHQHHDHLICLRCGKFIEVMDPKIEELQWKLARERGFVLERHGLEMYGICERCRKKKARAG